MMKPHRMSSLQAVRAVAAMMVVVFHINIFLLPHRLYDGENAFSLFNIGFAGVELFFALSGFIMIHVHRSDFGRVDRFGPFLHKRAVRVLPLYWLILTALLCAMALIPSIGPDTPPSLLEIISNYALFPGEKTMILELGWSLRHEMLFYAVFSFVILKPPVGVSVMAVWFGGCILNLFVRTSLFPFTFFFSAYNLIFVGGMAAAYLFPRLSEKHALAAVMGGGAFFLWIAMADLYHAVSIHMSVRTVLFGLSASFLLAGLARLEVLGRIRSPRILTAIGDSSYALYLVHIPVLTMTAPLVLATGMAEALPPMLMLALLLVLCVATAHFAHLIVEKPMTRVISAIVSSGGFRRIRQLASRFFNASKPSHN